MGEGSGPVPDGPEAQGGRLFRRVRLCEAWEAIMECLLWEVGGHRAGAGPSRVG